MPESSLRHGHIIGKDGTLIIDSVTVIIHEPSHEPREFFFDFGFRGQVPAIALCNVESPLMI